MRILWNHYYVWGVKQRYIFEVCLLINLVNNEDKRYIKCSSVLEGLFGIMLLICRNFQRLEEGWTSVCFGLTLGVIRLLVDI